jgi:hypothetical protein
VKFACSRPAIHSQALHEQCYKCINYDFRYTFQNVRPKSELVTKYGDGFQQNNIFYSNWFLIATPRYLNVNKNSASYVDHCHRSKSNQAGTINHIRHMIAIKKFPWYLSNLYSIWCNIFLCILDQCLQSLFKQCILDLESFAFQTLTFR